MKHNMTQIEGHNEPVGFANIIFGNCFLKVDHICYLAHPSPIPPNTLLEFLPRNPTGENDSCTIDVNNINIGHSSSTSNIWTMYFHFSKTWEGSGVGCILIDL